MPSAPRVLIALQPSMYAEVLAFSVGRERPLADVSILDASESLEEAALRLLPHLVVANRVPTKAAGEGWPFYWVEVDEPHAGEGAKRLGARISADGYSRSVDDVTTEHVILALDRAKERLISKGLSPARGPGTS